LVQAYLIHIADRNNNNFRKILDLKGIRSRQEQNHLVELFQLHRASDRYASNLQQSNPILTALQAPAAATTTGSVSQGLGLSGAGSMPSRFDASMLGSAIMSAAKDGVDRFGNPSLSALGASGVPGITGTPPPGSGFGGTSGTPSPATTTSAQQIGHAHTPSESTAAANLNENLKNIGKFFRRDLGSFGSRFGRGADDAA
jgi:hypothetical protein